MYFKEIDVSVMDLRELTEIREHSWHWTFGLHKPSSQQV